MAQVPISERRVQERPLGGEPVRAADFGAASREIGEGAQQLGQQMSNAAQAWDQIQASRDENEAKRTDITAAQQINQRSFLDDDAYFHRVGANATGVTASAQADFTKIRQTALDKLQTPRAKAMFSRMFDARVSNQVERLADHEFQQVRVDRIETAKASADANAGLAVDSSDDPITFRNTVADGFGDIAAQGQGLGWSDAHVKLAQSDYLSGVHSRVVEKLRVNDPKAAEAWIDQHQGEINDKDETQLRQTLVPGLEDAQYEDDMSAVRNGPAPVPEVAGTSGADRVEESRPAAGARVPVSLVLAALPMQESGGRERDSRGHLITSRAGAQGMMQVMPGTSVDPGYGVTPARDGSDAERSRVGRDYYKALDRHYGNTTLALTAYNAGPGKVDGWLKAFGDPREGQISEAAWLAKVPVEESREYAPAVLGRVGRQPAGAAQLVTNHPAIGETEQLYAKATALARSEGWSQKRYDRVLRGIDGVASRDRALLSDQEEQASRSLTDAVIAAGPGGITSVKQLGPSFYRASPTVQANYLEMIQKNNEPKEPAYNPALMLELSDQLATDPQAFARRDAAADLVKLPKGQQETYMGWRRSALGKEGVGEVKQIDHGRIVSVSRPLIVQAFPIDPRLAGAKKAEALGERAQHVLKFREVMSERLTEFQRINGKPPGDDDIFAMAQRVLTTLTFVDGHQGLYMDNVGSNGTMRQPAQVRVPNAEIAKIRGAYHARTGRDPTEAEIAHVWFTSGMRAR